MIDTKTFADFGIQLPHGASGEIDTETRTIPLTQGYVAVIDACDYERAMKHRWQASVRRNGAVYARSHLRLGKGKATKIYLHRFILDASEDVWIDHRDGDGLNCRRSNLRYATHQQNCFNQKIPSDNTSGARGVSWTKSLGKWHAYINLDGRRINLGWFSDLDDAIAARRAAERDMFGEFAPEVPR